ncbi:MAG TPA: GNAT family N-acetyltransferase [Candidatus Limnocylindria bacterium]|nr:GNAT family N-acetyltransferase [Candidatus Limnocylindria bacterium]
MSIPSISPAQPAVRTKRLLLRPWRDEDREPFAAMNADPVVMEHFPGTMSRQASDALVDRFRAHWQELGWGVWAVEIPAEAPFIGFVGLSRQDAPGYPVVEVGWRLARPFWGRGYATEGAQRGLGLGFGALALDGVVSFTVPQNTRSRAVMERIGMHHDAAEDFDHPRVDPLAYPHMVRHVLYRITRDDWRARHVQEERA